MAQHAINYSPRNSSQALHRIEPSEIRIPSTEELRERRARLFGRKTVVEDAPIVKPVAVDFRRSSPNGYDFVPVRVKPCGRLPELNEPESNLLCQEKNDSNPEETEVALGDCFSLRIAGGNVEMPSKSVDVTVTIEASQTEDASVESVISKYRIAYSSEIDGKKKVSQIIRDIAKAHNITIEQLISHRRAAPLVAARKEAYYTIAVVRPDLSWPQIAKHMGGKDHTTALWGAGSYAKAKGLPPVVRA